MRAISECPTRGPATVKVELCSVPCWSTVGEGGGQDWTSLSLNCIRILWNPIRWPCRSSRPRARQLLRVMMQTEHKFHAIATPSKSITLHADTTSTKQNSALPRLKLCLPAYLRVLVLCLPPLVAKFTIVSRTPAPFASGNVHFSGVAKV